MTNNSTRTRNALSERFERLQDRHPNRRTDQPNGTMSVSEYSRRQSGRTDRSDRTITIPEYSSNGNVPDGNYLRHHGEMTEPEDDEFTVPILPFGVAIVCGVTNFIIPGFGT